MCRKFFHWRASNLNKQRGSSLIMAVFMIVVFSVMAAVMVKIVSSSSQSISYEVLGTRAYAAAKIGNQWALQRIFPLGGSAAQCTIEVTNPIVINIVSGLESCRIQSVKCNSFYKDNVNYYTIISKGICEVGDVSTSRTLKVEARSL